MDERVKEVQVWLNKTYSGVAGYDKVPENGRTGWATIYGLREGLQKEIGVKNLGQGFGDQTKAALRTKIDSIKPGMKGNIVKLIKGAFWCKGISPKTFTEDYDILLSNAVLSFQKAAGVKADGKLTVNLMAALFDMRAFVLIPGKGKEKVREMQQYLNRKFSDELGIMPCDGIYQRETNTALIFALQKAIGVKGANGNYGPGTIAATPTVNQGATGDTVRVIQYGLYVNGFYDGRVDGTFSEAVSNGIIQFRKFMNLPPFTGVADLTVIKGLLTSNGNTDRAYSAADMATQLTTEAVATLKKNGINIVGRYLTGSVGTGKNKRDKSLSVAEIKRITDGGLSIFPLYEDGGYEESYFNGNQGYTDGFIAINAARELGFSKGATIYFAVDVDIQDGDIAGTVGPYMQGVIAALESSEYTPGVYGTRNVCLHGEELGMKYSFVADMSYGWSGNLGFKMPKNWAFDQFTEQPVGGVEIDHVATSGKDAGSKEFEVRKVASITPEKALEAIGETLKNLLTKLTLNHEVTVVNEPYPWC